MTQSYIEHLVLKAFMMSLDGTEPTVADLPRTERDILDALRHAEEQNPPVNMQYGRELLLQLADGTMVAVGKLEEETENNNYAIQIASTGRIAPANDTTPKF